MSTIRQTCLLVAITNAALCATSAAQTLGTAITYQGRLESSNLPASGSHDLRFTLYNASAGGSVVAGPICADNVAVSDGLFTVTLDFGAAAFDGDALWLGIEVRADATSGNCTIGAYTLLTSRQPLTATPYALGLRLPFAGNASVQNGAPLHVTNTYPGPLFSAYGIWGETAHPSGRGVYGSAPASSVGGFGVYGESQGSSGYGVFGFGNAASGANYGEFGRSDSAQGAGIFGRATASAGTTFGVRGQCDSATGYAGYFTGGRNYFEGDVGIGTLTPRQQFSLGANLDIYSGSANAPTRPSIRGSSSNNLVLNASDAGAVYFNFDGGTGGVRFHDGTSAGEVMRLDSDGDLGLGTTAPSSKLHVFGRSGAYACSVVQGNTSGGCAQFVMQNSSNSLNALRGVHFNTTSTGVGVYGEGFVGVYGHSPELTGVTYGVQGWAPSRSGRSVYGRASDAPAGFTSYGILGEETAQSFGWAVYAIGDVGATGSKAFRIDHPDDPEQKYLLHYCPESPEIINFYSGNVTLDAAGKATVELPRYFAKVNKDPRYALTPIGAAMPNLHVAEEISAAVLAEGEAAKPGVTAPSCSFRIAGGVAGGRVSWEVKALRNDRWVRTRGAPVEVEKAIDERGTYQHPELYGQPETKGMNYPAVRAMRQARTVSSRELGE